MQYSHAFFDLDGTLTNSAPGITHSVQYALRKFGITQPPEEELTVFVGPPLVQSFSKYFGMDTEQSLLAVDYYREYYRAGGMLENEVYDGIPALLEELNARGIVCVLATCKPYEFAEKILAHFGLDKYFAFVSGPEMDGRRGEKHEVIAYAMEQLSLPDAKKILMVGDRRDDVLGALHHGIDCAGVLWGFGTEEELTEAGALQLCHVPHDLLSFFEKKGRS
jgi:phosphoglycolate phosphatase